MPFRRLHVCCRDTSCPPRAVNERRKRQRDARCPPHAVNERRKRQVGQLERGTIQAVCINSE